MSVTNNTEVMQFELVENGHLAFAKYKLESGVLYIRHVEAPPELRGTGTAGRLMKGVMDTARKEHWKVIPICGYAASWIDRNGEYTDLLT